MPWDHSDAHKHNHAADTPHKQKLWAKVANSTLEHTGDDAAAIRAANSVLKHLAEKRAAESSDASPPRRTGKSVLGTGMTPHWSKH